MKNKNKIPQPGNLFKTLSSVVLGWPCLSYSTNWLDYKGKNNVTNDSHDTNDSFIIIVFQSHKVSRVVISKLFYSQYCLSVEVSYLPCKKGNALIGSSFQSSSSPRSTLVSCTYIHRCKPTIRCSLSFDVLLERRVLTTEYSKLGLLYVLIN